MDKIKVIDLRERFFKVSNLFIDSGICSPYEISVYILLCRYANNITLTSFPSLTNICEKTNMARASAVKSLKLLELKGFIKIKRQEKRLPNIYYLLPIKKGSSPGDHVVHQANIGSSPGDQKVVHQVDSIKTLKKTKEKEQLGNFSMNYKHLLGNN